MRSAGPSAITTGIPWIDALIPWTIVAGIIGGAAAKVLHWAIPFFRRLDEVIETILGRDGKPPLDDRLDTIEHELFPNSGGSMRDVVDRVEKHMTDVDGKVVGVAENLDDHVEQSKLMRARGRETEHEIRQTISNLAEAVKIAAQSTPPHCDDPEHEHTT